MRSIGMALTWEFWRRSWWWILSAVMLMACVTTTATALYGSASPPDTARMAGIHYRAVFHLFLCVVFFSLWSQLDKKDNRLGFPAHLFIKPAQTWVFVGWQMLFPAVTIALLYLAEVGCVRILWGSAWPLVGPILLLITAVACTQAVFWSMVAHPVLRAVTCLLVLGVVQAWQFSRYGAIRDYPNVSRLTEMWSTLSFGELLTLAPGLVAAYVAAVLGVSRDRCGDCLGWPKVRAILDSAMNLLPARHKPFNSPAAAQFWREWHEKDRLFPAVCGVWVAIIILLGVFGIMDTMHTMGAFILMLQIGFVVPLFAGLGVGQCGRKSVIDDFKATLPVNDSRLSAMILRPGAAGVLAAWLIYVAAVSLMIGWYFMIGKGDTVPLDLYQAAKRIVLELGYAHAALLVVAGIVMVWGNMGLGASMTLMGRPWLLWVFWLVICSIGPTVMALDTLDALNLLPFSVRPLLHSLPWTVGISCLIGTASAFVTAHRRHLIGSTKLFVGLGLWLMLCFSIGWAWIPRGDPSSTLVVLAMGLFALPVAPLATAPLALAWNRHR